MNKTFLRLVTLISIASCSIILSTHELRTPLSLNSKLNKNGGYMHYPLPPAVDSLWSVDLWAGAYYRRADYGMAPKHCDWCCPDNSCYVCDPCCNACPNMCGVYRKKELFKKTCNCCDCCSNCFNCGCCCDDCRLNIRSPFCLRECGPYDVCCIDEDACNAQKIPLAELFFGKARFKGEEAFYGSSLTGRASGHPGLSFAYLRPTFDYNERGVILGLHAERRVEDSKLRFGFNVTLPVKAIEIELNCCIEDPDDDLKNVVAYKHERLPVWELGNPCNPLDTCNALNTVNQTYTNEALYTGTCRNVHRLDIALPGESFAYRLDYLSTLLMPDGVTPVVQYGDGSFKVAGVDLTDEPHAAVAWRPYPEGIPDLQTPAQERCTRFAVYCADVENPDFPVVEGNGDFRVTDTMLDATRAKFIGTEDYRLFAGELDKQSKTFIVPVYFYDEASNHIIEYLPYAQAIKNIVDQILNGMALSGDGSALNFFSDHGICFCCNDHNCGLGDLDIQCYGGYDFTEHAFGEIVFGLKLPTGRKNKNPKRIFWQPTGNNGHFEVRFGMAGGWRSEKWFGFTADFSYSHVLEACEKKAASFVCSSVKNIGPCISARVKWGYFLAHLDMTVFNPYNENMGLALGYEAYYKRRDKICFCPCDANYLYRDLLGDRYPLDSTILEKNTNILTHKLRGEVFHRWNYFELYAGASRVVGGWNGMRETEAHLGCSIYF